jgi:hypothetical protein
VAGPAGGDGGSTRDRAAHYAAAMPNTSYLCVTGHDGLYPSATLPDYDPALHTLACDVGCVPLLWLALFRPGDLRTETFAADPDDGEDDPGTVVATAPVAAKQTALARLDTAVPVLERLFDGPLGEHATLLRHGVEAMPGTYVTIELDEIDALYTDDEDFSGLLRQALAGLEVSTDPAADRARLERLSRLRPGRPIPPARLVLDGLEAPDDWWNYCRLLGTGLYRPVPWEERAVAATPGA